MALSNQKRAQRLQKKLQSQTKPFLSPKGFAQLCRSIGQKLSEFLLDLRYPMQAQAHVQEGGFHLRVINKRKELPKSCLLHCDRWGGNPPVAVVGRPFSPGGRSTSQPRR